MSETLHRHRLFCPFQGRRTATALFACFALVWLVFDVLTKAFFNNGSYQLGQHIAGPYLGLFRFVLVHNTGGAWGIFSDSTFALGVFSLTLCALILGVFIWRRKSICLLETLGLALLVAGGLGNAIDRFNLGYVVDFIEFTFVDFPVFNIADIGVTCGIVLFFIGFIVNDSEERQQGA